MHKHVKTATHYGLIVLATVPVFAYIFFHYYPSQEQLRAANGGMLNIAARYVSALDGKTVKAKTATTPQVVGVVIDNHPDSRPSLGLSKASIVYEVPVEGGLTRFLALYDANQTVVQVGPVRSARPYFIDWLQEYGNGMYMHSGGSPEALKLVKERPIFDVNEFWWGSYYWRDGARSSPHNLFTRSELWQQIIADKQITSTFKASRGWRFASLIGKGPSSKKEVRIVFSPSHEVVWKYDPKTLYFVRYVNGVTHLDADEFEIRARNVLVQHTSVRTIDSEGRKEIKTVGSGDARVLKKGQAILATWKKESLTGRTRFYDKKGREIVMLPGTTWVEVVPNDAVVVVSN